MCTRRARESLHIDTPDAPEKKNGSQKRVF
jgi:hypothetical protein